MKKVRTNDREEKEKVERKQAVGWQVLNTRTAEQHEMEACKVSHLRATTGCCSLQGSGKKQTKNNY